MYHQPPRPKATDYMGYNRDTITRYLESVQRPWWRRWWRRLLRR